MADQAPGQAPGSEVPEVLEESTNQSDPVSQPSSGMLSLPIPKAPQSSAGATESGQDGSSANLAADPPTGQSQVVASPAANTTMSYTAPSTVVELPPLQAPPREEASPPQLETDDKAETLASTTNTTDMAQQSPMDASASQERELPTKDAPSEAPSAETKDSAPGANAVQQRTVASQEGDSTDVPVDQQPKSAEAPDDTSATVVVKKKDAFGRDITYRVPANPESTPQPSKLAAAAPAKHAARSSPGRATSPRRGRSPARSGRGAPPDRFQKGHHSDGAMARSGSPPPHSRLFLGNLPCEKVSKRELMDMFGRYGRVLEISLHRSFGFVQFDSAQSAAAARDGEQGKVVGGLTLALSHRQGLRVVPDLRRPEDPDFADAIGREIADIGLHVDALAYQPAQNFQTLMEQIRDDGVKFVCVLPDAAGVRPTLDVHYMQGVPQVERDVVMAEAVRIIDAWQKRGPATAPALPTMPSHGSVAPAGVPQPRVPADPYGRPVRQPSPPPPSSRYEAQAPLHRGPPDVGRTYYDEHNGRAPNDYDRGYGRAAPPPSREAYEPAAYDNYARAPEPGRGYGGNSNSAISEVYNLIGDRGNSRGPPPAQADYGRAPAPAGYQPRDPHPAS
ncbi:uncharacterized protein MONBRDRAFT_7035 [Monosiga brevicollis MX1]|uniref:RRM domain-containing protein n=1 Tax=Monosiga brevicollis TaxID=81824 RepID=A9UVQ1_MONBE|nr:uncharacterized protein MONBRDRAFT_7035 [Monosiga brevicollis MX1]EDQ90433.1 predicted protein [Monosiga brevicollis MX1]|eukprot:XP_001744484.1 hypothetical protein [Monosiga brevicollis MX1]